MKIASCYLFIFILLPAAVYAQKKNKVHILYKSAVEFTSKNASINFDCTGQNKILLNDFFNKSYVTIKQQDSTYRLFKQSIYGYQNCGKNVYRFFGKKELLLLNGGEEIWVYNHQLSKPPAGRTNVTNYYFSIGKEGEVQKLTFKNLKKTFNENPAFLDLIDGTFKYNTDLAKFDDINKIFVINFLLKKSRN